MTTPLSSAKIMDKETRQKADRPITLLVTGFGPFHHHKVNASWEAVKELVGVGVKCGGEDVHIEIREMPVVYRSVQENLESIWDKVKPDLCIHVGVSPYNVIKLEKRGSNTGYCYPDNMLSCPVDGICKPGGPNIIETPFDLDKICQQVTLRQNDVKVEISTDAGQYLCDFIYYSSLHLKMAPVLFVHVPPLDAPYSLRQLAESLKNIAECLLIEMGLDK